MRSEISQTVCRDRKGLFISTPRLSRQLGSHDQSDMRRSSRRLRHRLMKKTMCTSVMMAIALILVSFLLFTRRQPPEAGKLQILPLGVTSNVWEEDVNILKGLEKFSVAVKKESTRPMICTQPERLRNLRERCENTRFPVEPLNTDVLHIEDQSVGFSVSDMSTAILWENLLSHNKSIKQDLIHMKPLTDVISADGKFVIDTENPFERLYSSYLQRIFIPLSWEEAQKIALRFQPGVSCPFNVSFTHFLTYVIEQDIRHKTLHRHWARMTSLSLPCDVNVMAIVLQDTYISDVQYVFRNMGIKVLDDAAFGNIIHTNKLKSLLKTYIDGYKMLKNNEKLAPLINHCLSDTLMTSRMWTMLEKKGYDDLMNSIPLESLQEVSLFGPELFQVLSDNIQYIDETERRSSWQASVQNAYHQVPRVILEKIGLIYKEDIELFNFDKTPYSFIRNAHC